MSTNISVVLADLATCLCSELNHPTCFCGVLPAGDPIDMMGDCEGDNCGQAWVRLTTAYPAEAVGTPDQTLNNCRAPLSFEAEIGVLRCFPVEEMYDSADMLSSAQQQAADIRAMERAIRCCDSLEEYILGPYTPVGPQGGALGGVFTLSIGGY